MRIPEKGISKDRIHELLQEYRAQDNDWRSGRTWGYIYDPGLEVEEVAKMAYMEFLSENALDPTTFPSLGRFEKEICRMAATHVGGGEEVVGNFTTGGTESIMLAVKTARDHARAHKPHLEHPAMVVPITAHAAFHKAGHYLGVEVVTTDVDPVTFRADVGAMAQAITEDTILLVGSAPQYAHGCIDPIAEIAALAAARGLLMHVDACMGGFLLPYFRRLGEPIPAFGFEVPGVTSLSMDLHKYAYAPKGASVILYRDKALRRHQLYACAGWTGYTVVNATAGSSKSGGPLAAAWSVLNYLGDEGYLELARGKLAAQKALFAGINAIDGLYVLGTPEMSLVCFTSDTVNVFHIVDEMKTRGWYVQPQLRLGPSKENIHLSIAASNVRWVEALLVDLRASVEVARTLPNGPMAPMVAGMFANVDPKHFSAEQFGQMLAMAGIKGGQLPPRMAEINEVLNALPPVFRELMLIEFINDLFV